MKRFFFINNILFSINSLLEYNYIKKLTDNNIIYKLLIFKKLAKKLIIKK